LMRASAALCARRGGARVARKQLDVSFVDY
jgi:hypothetical protein